MFDSALESYGKVSTKERMDIVKEWTDIVSSIPVIKRVPKQPQETIIPITPFISTEGLTYKPISPVNDMIIKKLFV